MKVISILKKHPFDEFAADFAHLFEVNSRQKLTEEWPSISRRKRRTISALYAVGSTARRCAI